MRAARRSANTRSAADAERSDFVLLTLGTGIGGGIVAGGRLMLGYRWGAGEIGHHQIRPTDGFVCGCGKIGCFEAQASGTGLIRHAFAVAPSFPRSSLLDVARDKLSSKKIRKAAQAGDKHAIAAWNNFIADLAIGLANVIAFVNPETIALGGGVSIGRRFHARRRSRAGGRADDDGSQRNDRDRDRGARQRCRASRGGRDGV